MQEVFPNIDDPRVAGGSLWQEVARTIAALDAIVYRDARVNSPVLRAEGLRYLTRLVAGAIAVTIDGWDADYPALLKLYTPYLQYGIPSPDCYYQTAAIHGAHVYRLHGRPGRSRLFDIETREGHTADLTRFPRIDRRTEFDIDAQGDLEVTLSVAPRPGNWLRIAEGAGTLMVRQYFYDWHAEEPAALAIERVGARYPPPPLTSGTIAARLDLLIAWLKQLPVICRRGVEEYYKGDPGVLEFVPNALAIADIEYGKGTYRCGADEAVILELEPPQAPYWSVQLASHYWEALDWNVRQTSINGHQAALDEDGRFRAVISHADPGVPNWLDAGGHETGLITARYFQARPTSPPTLKTVAFDALSSVLPRGTRRVTPLERQASLCERMRSVSRRRMDAA